MGIGFLIVSLVRRVGIMAWYAELKRRRWYCIIGIDMIRLYKKKLYDDWYNSLTDEEKQRLE